MSAARWRATYPRWRDLLDDERCRAWLRSRVDVIGDPRLRTEDVETILDRLPALLLGAHAALAAATAASDSETAVRDAAIIRGSGFAVETVDRALVEACAPHVERLREVRGRLLNTDLEPDDWDRSLAEVLREAETGEHIKVLRALLGENHRVTTAILDEMASCVHERVVTRVNRQDRDGVTTGRLWRLRRDIDFLEHSCRIAVGTHAAEQIRLDIVTLLNNVTVHLIDFISSNVDANPSLGLRQQGLLFEETTDALERLAELDPQLAVSLRTQLAFTAHNMLIAYVNATRDARSALGPMRGLRHKTDDPQARAQIARSVRDLEEAQSQSLIDTWPDVEPPQRTFAVGTDGNGAQETWRAGRQTQNLLDHIRQCTFCYKPTHKERTFGFRRIQPVSGVEWRRIAVACCGDCMPKSLRYGWWQLPCAIASPVVLVLMSLTAVVLDWSWSQTRGAVATIAFLGVFAWLSMARTRWLRYQLAQQPEVRQARDAGWVFEAV